MIDPEENNAQARKEAKRIRKLFREVFKNNEGEEVLTILGNIFDAHLPSMAITDFEPIKAAYKDGQKSVLIEITDIMKGKYDE